MESRMQTIAIVGQKGGIGKTTLAIHLAVAATHAGHTTALIDLDPQGSAAGWGDLRENADIPDKEYPVVISAHAARLKQVLQKAAEHGITCAIVDTPAQLEAPVTAAAKVATLAVIPCLPAMFEVKAIASTIDLTRQKNALIRVVFNAVPPRSSKLLEAKQAVKDTYDVECAPCIIGRRILFSHVLVDGKTAQEFDPESKAATEIQTLYKYLEKQLALAKETTL